MKQMQWGTPKRCRVTAIFQTESAFFELPPAATFGDLADRVDHLSRQKHAALVGVNVMLASQGSAVSARNTGLSKAGIR